MGKHERDIKSSANMTSISNGKPSGGMRTQVAAGLMVRQQYILSYLNKAQQKQWNSYSPARQRKIMEEIGKKLDRKMENPYEQPAAMTEPSAFDPALFWEEETAGQYRNRGHPDPMVFRQIAPLDIRSRQMTMRIKAAEAHTDKNPGDGKPLAAGKAMGKAVIREARRQAEQRQQESSRLQIVQGAATVRKDPSTEKRKKRSKTETEIAVKSPARTIVIGKLQADRLRMALQDRKIETASGHNRYEEKNGSQRYSPAKGSQMKSALRAKEAQQLGKQAMTRKEAEEKQIRIRNSQENDSRQNKQADNRNRALLETDLQTEEKLPVTDRKGAKPGVREKEKQRKTQFQKEQAEWKQKADQIRKTDQTAVRKKKEQAALQTATFSEERVSDDIDSSLAAKKKVTAHRETVKKQAEKTGEGPAGGEKSCPASDGMMAASDSIRKTDATIRRAPSVPSSDQDKGSPPSLRSAAAASQVYAQDLSVEKQRTARQLKEQAGKEMTQPDVKATGTGHFLDPDLRTTEDISIVESVSGVQRKDADKYQHKKASGRWTAERENSLPVSGYLNGGKRSLRSGSGRQSDSIRPEKARMSGRQAKARKRKEEKYRKAFLSELTAIIEKDMAKDQNIRQAQKTGQINASIAELTGQTGRSTFRTAAIPVRVAMNIIAKRLREEFKMRLKQAAATLAKYAATFGAPVFMILIIVMLLAGICMIGTSDQSGGYGLGYQIVQEAKKHLGLPYVYGGTSLTEGCDCSGFVWAIYNLFGYNLPRTAGDQYSYGRKISSDINDWQMGDLIYYSRTGDVQSGGGRAEHIVIYAGGGQVISCGPVAIYNWDYRSDYVGTCRIIPDEPMGGDFSGSTNEEICWNYFLSKGFTRAATAGIMGNMYVESGGTFDPSIHQFSGGPGRGLCQWEESYGGGSGRYNTLVSFASGLGLSWDDITAQLQFVSYELDNGSMNPYFAPFGGVEAFKHSDDPATATYVFLCGFEYCGDPGQSYMEANFSLSTRVDHARWAYLNYQ